MKYLQYNQTTIPTFPNLPDTSVVHVYRVAGSFTASLEIEKAGGLKDKANLPQNDGRSFCCCWLFDDCYVF